MRAKGLIVFAAAAALLIGSAATAAEKIGKPLGSKDPLASTAQDKTWRQRALDARAEVPTGSIRGGNARAVDERGDRKDGEESGGGRLREDRGEGGAE